MLDYSSIFKVARGEKIANCIAKTVLMKPFSGSAGQGKAKKMKNEKLSEEKLLKLAGTFQSGLNPFLQSPLPRPSNTQRLHLRFKLLDD